MKSQKTNFRLRAVSSSRLFFATITLLAISLSLYAQDGNAGLSEATTKVKGYFTDASNLMIAIGSIVGIGGAIKVYKKWNDGDHDTGKVVAAWIGSLVFLVLVTTILRSFFSV